MRPRVEETWVATSSHREEWEIEESGREDGMSMMTAQRSTEEIAELKAEQRSGMEEGMMELGFGRVTG